MGQKLLWVQGSSTVIWIWKIKPPSIIEVLKIALLCSYRSPYERLLMRHVVLVLSESKDRAWVCVSVDGDSSKGNDAAKMMGATLLDISCKFVSAFQNLRKSNTNIQIPQFEKEALFTAVTLTRKLQNE